MCQNINYHLLMICKKIKVDRTIENFVGIEEIYKDEKLIYRLNCHGGIIE